MNLVGNTAQVVPMPVNAMTDGALVGAARAGEVWAQEALYRRHVRHITGLVFRLAPRHEGLDDLVQDVFVAALTSLHQLRDPEHFEAWLRGIVVRLAARRLRWHRLQRRLGLLAEEPSDIDYALSKTASPEVVAELRRVYAVLGKLAPEERIALVLKRVEGYTQEQIAQVLGTSIPTAKRRIEKAEHALALHTAEGMR